MDGVHCEEGSHRQGPCEVEDQRRVGRVERSVQEVEGERGARRGFEQEPLKGLVHRNFSSLATLQSPTM